MNTKEAKDYLLQQTAEQAALENVVLSDVEKRMLYFTESDPSSCDNPIDLNDEFESQYDTSEYEAKMSALLHHTYKRLKRDSPSGLQNWDEAIRTLRAGDHYLLILWGAKSNLTSSVKNDSGRKVIACGGITVVLFFLSVFTAPHLPAWIPASLMVLVFLLCFLTIFFLLQQGYRAFRSRNTRQ